MGWISAVFVVTLVEGVVCMREVCGMFVYRYVQWICGVVVDLIFPCVSCVFELCVMCGIRVVCVLN